MDAPSLWCPRGHGRLVRSATNGVHETCDACHGFAVTIWLLDELLADGVGPGIWRRSATTDVRGQGDGCPACRHPMTKVPVSDQATPPEVEVCRDCELIWVEPAALAALAIRPELATTGASAPEPTHCPACGAPNDDTDADRCRYCHAALPHRSLDVTAPLLAELAACSHAQARASSGLVEQFIDVTGGDSLPY